MNTSAEQRLNELGVALPPPQSRSALTSQRCRSETCST